MFTRLTHAAIAFAVTAVLYQCYFLAVVPFIEPAWTASAAAASSSDELIDGGAEALDKHRDLLAKYFPPTHWCFARPPKTLENGQMLIVCNEYQQSNTGLLTVPQCAVLFFPGGRDQGAPPPSDAIILESSGGATLQMELAEGGANVFGPLQNGTLNGEVTVRSDMREPGPQDDLLIKTRELYMNEDLIRTDQPVDIKLGKNHGFGRELEIRRMKTENSAGGGMGLYGSFQDLVIKHDVSFSATPGESKLLGAAVPAGGPAAPPPPIRIKSAGPFRIDFGAYKATFEDQVRTWQLHPDGKMDELLATKLTLYFAKATKWNAEAAGATAGGVLGGGSMTFEPASLEAIGTPEAPVQLKAPSHDASAIGQNLSIEMVGGQMSRITLQQGDEVVLRHQGAEIHARILQYQLPPAGSGQRLGIMKARGGGGWLRAAVDPARPDQILVVSWKDAMQLIRRDGQPVLVLDGRPKVDLTGMGTLWADQLQIFLREQPSTGNAPLKMDSASLAAGISPERITATGRVGIESTALNGKVNQLVIKIAQPAVAAPAVGAAQGADVGNAKPQAASPLAFGGGVPKRAYYIEGVTLEIDAVLRDRRPDVQAIRVDGGVIFEESAAVSATDPPLRIVAEHLRVTGADTPNAQIEIIGGGGQNGIPPQDAEIYAGGAEIRAPALRLNRGTSEALINSPGKLKLMVDRDMSGNPLPAPQPLDIAWQRSMKLEGRRITFLGQVEVRNDSGWLHTEKLIAQTTEDIRFDGAGGGGRPQLEQLECWEGAVAEFYQRDLSGVISRQHVEVQSLRANHVTGALDGMGPGHIDSVHFSKGPAALLALPAAGGGGGAQAPGLVPAGPPELRHLHIDFLREIRGNLRTSSVAVHGNVEAVYGPVASWDQRLAMTPGGNPGVGEVWITADMLGVTESPMARLQAPQQKQFELTAEGHANIEGRDSQQGEFNAYGHRARYDQSKGTFILEGDGVTPATIEQRGPNGGPSSPFKAQRMEFNQQTGSVKAIGGQGQFNQVPK
jgi:hypothetical protein